MLGCVQEWRYLWSQKCQTLKLKLQVAVTQFPYKNRTSF